MDKEKATTNKVANKAKQGQTPQTATKTQRRPISVSHLLSSFALLISLACLVVILRHNGQQNVELKKLERRVNNQSSELIAKNQSSQDEQQQSLKTIQSQLEAYQKQTSHLGQELRNVSKHNRQSDKEWQLNRANYLLSLAQLSAHFEQSPNQATILLEASDSIIKELKDPRFLPLRQTLSNEITALKATPTIDKEGILATLNSLQQSANKLEIKKRTGIKISEEEKAGGDQSDSGWHQALKKSFDKLSKLIIIRRNSDLNTKVISPTERGLLVEQLRLSLQKAQWALLYRDKAIYQFSINQALSLLDNYFEANSLSMSVSTTLEKLKQTNVSPSIPNIERSKQQLQQLLSANDNGAS